MSSKTQTYGIENLSILNYLLAHVNINNMGRGLLAGVAQLVEHHLAKVDVEGSNPFARSIKTP